MLAARAAAIIFAASALAGCSSGAMQSPGQNPAPVTPPQPAVATAPPTGFLPDPARMTADSRYRFQHSWVQPGVDFRNYPKVMLAPISLEYLAPPAAASSGTPQDNRHAAVDIAIFAGEEFTHAVQNDPSHRLTLVTAADAKTIIVEMALVELTPNTQPSSADAFGMPTTTSASSALQREANLNGRGAIAMELKLRDGNTSQVIAIFADARRAKAPSGEERLAPGYGFANDIAGDWMSRIVAMLDS
ncbi:MAG TPA: DUF3313 family protein [Candidatus Binataceae bacterium]|nr:DUF3313 family protein [Candidatus Binataceae bacterium]